MFHIYFQSGEFLGDAGGVFKDYIIPLLSVATFFLGLEWEKRKSRRQKVEQEEKKLIYLTYLIRMTDQYCSISLIELGRLIERLDKDAFDLSGFARPTDNYLQIFTDKLNQEDYYLAYINKYEDQVSEIGMIFSATYSIAKISKNLTAVWMQSLDNNNKASRRIGEGVKAFTQELRRLEVESAVPAGVIKGIVSIQKEYSEGQKANGNSYSYSYGQIGPKLFLRIADFIDLPINYTLKKELNKLYNLVSENYTWLGMLEKDNNHAKTEFINLKNNLENSYSLLKSHNKSLIQDFGSIDTRTIT